MRPMESRLRVSRGLNHGFIDGKTDIIRSMLHRLSHNVKISIDVMILMWITKQTWIYIMLATKLAMKLNCSIWAFCALTGHKMLSGRKLSCVLFAYRNKFPNGCFPKSAEVACTHLISLLYPVRGKKVPPVLSGYFEWNRLAHTSGFLSLAALLPLPSDKGRTARFRHLLAVYTCSTSCGAVKTVDFFVVKCHFLLRLSFFLH